MKLECQVVESASQVVEGLAKKKTPFGRNRFEFAHTHAVLKAASMRLDRDRPELAINSAMQLPFEYAVVLGGTAQSHKWTLEIARHHVIVADCQRR
jgi:hypothetical protein